MITIRIPECPGVCRICKCTHFTPCDEGCGWANRKQTLCTSCVEVDKLLRTAAGRLELRDAIDEARFHRAKAAAEEAALAKKRRRRSSRR